MVTNLSLIERARGLRMWIFLLVGTLSLFVVSACAPCTACAALRASPDPAISGSIVVSVSPEQVLLEPSALQVFTVSVTNAIETGVLWTPSCGVISASDMTATFSAPANDASCTLTVSSVEDEGVAAIASITVRRGNVAPVLSSFGVSPTTIHAGRSVTFTWVVSDSDGDALSCQLDVDGDGADEYTFADCASGSQDHVYSAAGTYLPRVVVSDTQASTLSMTNLVITPNSAPTVESFSVSPSSVEVGETVTFSWVVNDGDGDALACALDVDGNGLADFSVAPCSTGSQEHAFASASVYSASMSVSDSLVAATSVTDVTVLVPFAFTHLSGGDRHTVAVDSRGQAWAWGNNSRGQLGDGTTDDSLVPVQVSSTEVFTAVAAGLAHSLALDDVGMIWAFGYNLGGQLGDGTVIDRSLPVQVSSTDVFTSVAVGQVHSLAIDDEGKVWAWGNNIAGQLGDGTTNSSLVPIEVNSFGTTTAIASRPGHSLALDDEGHAWAWGVNNLGQLGDGTVINRSLPVQVSSTEVFTAVAAGFYHSLALDDEGNVWAWGLNGDGQLGDGTTDDSLVPVQVSSTEVFTGVAAGFNHSLALDDEGNAWAWGLNDDGQLGDGTTDSRSVPVAVSVP